MSVILTVSGILILLYGLWIAAFVFLQRRDPASTTARKYFILKIVKKS